MSIEKTLERIADSLEILVTGQKQLPFTAPVVDVPVTTATETVATATPATMPAVTPAPVVPAVTLPFNDAKTLSAYVMSKYRTLGPVKGALIQNVLGELGLKNVNDVQPAQYEIFWAKVEAL